jgi:hypothetical protein
MRQWRDDEIRKANTMTLTETQAMLDDLRAAMVAKGVNSPRAELWLKGDNIVWLILWGNRVLLEQWMEDAPVSNKVDLARKYIAALPDPELEGPK